MARLENIQKDINLLNKIKEAINTFSFRKNIQGYKHFAEKLFFTSINKDKQFSNLLNSSNEKYLKLDEFLLLLNSLEEEKEIILEHLVNRYDYTLVKRNHTILNIDDLKDVLLQLTSQNGQLITAFYEATKDNYLSIKEKEELREKMREAYSFLGILEKALQ